MLYYLRIYITLALCCFQQIIASENFRHEDDLKKNSIVAVSTKKSKDESTLAEVRQKLLTSSSDAQADVRYNVLKFISMCLTNYTDFTGLDPIKAKIQFYGNKDIFAPYLTDDFAPNIRAMSYFYFYSEAARFYLFRANLRKAKQNFLEASHYRPDDIREGLRALLCNYLQASNTQDLFRKQGLIPEQFVSLYKDVIEQAFSQPLKTIDYINLTLISAQTHCYERLVEFSEHALSASWDECLGMVPRIGKNLLLTKEYLNEIVAINSYSQSDYKTFKKYASSLPIKPLGFLCYEAVFEAEQKNWIQLKKTLIDFFVSLLRATEERGLSINYICSERELLAFLRAYNHLQKSKENPELLTLVKQMIVFLKQSCPEEYLPLLNKYLKDFSEEKRKEFKRVVKKQIIAKYLLSLTHTRQGYDYLYQTTWARISKYSEGFEKLDELDTRARIIEEVYKRTILLIEDQNLDGKILKVRNALSSFKNLVSQFSVEAKKIEDELCALRKSRQNQATSSQEMPVFFGPNYKHENLKSLYRDVGSEQNERPSESSNSSQTRIKLETQASSSSSKSSIQLQPQESVQDKVKKAVAEESSSSTQTSAIKSFKNRNVAHQIWEQRDDTQFPGAHEIMQALNKSSSIYNLRQKLNSGAKLEILKGERKGQISLRVNDQWRICFTWETGVGAHDLEIVDYH